MSITMKELARLAGVSQSTVSLALSDDPRVAAATRERLLLLADKMDFSVNHFARALKTRESALLGFLIPRISHSIFAGLFDGAAGVARKNGYGILVDFISIENQIIKEQFTLFKERKIDGLLVISNSYAPLADWIKDFHKRGIPTVICSGESDNPDVPFVVIDNFRGGMIAAEHLVSLGHRRIAYCYLGGCPDDPVAAKRYAGCLECAARNNLEAPRFVKSPAALLELMGSPRRPTGLVMFSDKHAVDAKHLLESRGFCVPKDVSITGFDNSDFTEWPEFSLTSIDQPREEMGRMAAGMLMQLARGEHVESRLLEPTLVIRKSCISCQKKEKRAGAAGKKGGE